MKRFLILLILVLINNVLANDSCTFEAFCAKGAQAINEHSQIKKDQDQLELLRKNAKTASELQLYGTKDCGEKTKIAHEVRTQYYEALKKYLNNDNFEKEKHELTLKELVTLLQQLLQEMKAKQQEPIIYTAA